MCHSWLCFLWRQNCLYENRKNKLLIKKHEFLRRFVRKNDSDQLTKHNRKGNKITGQCTYFDSSLQNQTIWTLWISLHIRFIEIVRFNRENSYKLLLMATTVFFALFILLEWRIGKMKRKYERGKNDELEHTGKKKKQK